MSVQPKAPGEKSGGAAAALGLVAFLVGASLVFTVLMMALFNLEVEIIHAASAWWKGE